MLTDDELDHVPSVGEITAYMAMLLIEVVSALRPHGSDPDEILETIANRLLEGGLKLPKGGIHSLVAGTAYDLIQTEPPAMNS